MYLGINVNIRFDGGPITAELEQFMKAMKSESFELATVAPESERIMITSQYIAILNLYCQRNPKRAKLIRSNFRDMVVSVVDDMAKELLGGSYHLENNMALIHKRLVETVKSVRGGSELSLLNIMRTFTGVSMPFSAAQHCGWLTDEVLEVFCEVAFVRPDWVVYGNGPKSPYIPMGYTNKGLASDTLLQADLKLENSIAYVVVAKSKVSSDLDVLVLVTQSISNKNIEFASPVTVIQPRLRSDCLADLKTFIGTLSQSLIPINVAEVTQMEYQEAVTGSILLSDLIARSILVPASKHELFEV